MAESLSLINAIPCEGGGVEALLHKVVDSIGGLSPEFGKLRFSRDFDPLVRSFTNFFILAGGKKMDTKEVEEYLTTHKVASTHTSAVCSVLAARRDAIVDILKDLSVTGLSPSSLADFDWAVRVAVSSEKIADMKREPILMLSLNLKSADSCDTLRTVNIEFTRTELDNLIGTLSEVHDAVQEIRRINE